MLFHLLVLFIVPHHSFSLNFYEYKSALTLILMKAAEAKQIC